VLSAVLATGLRQSFGLFRAPMTAAHAWSAGAFAMVDSKKYEKERNVAAISFLIRKNTL
jgi:hypothetical protein